MRLTVVCVLSGDIGDGIADLVANRSLGFAGECLEKLLPDGYSLVRGQRYKHF